MEKERTKGRQAGTDDRHVQLNGRPDESINIEPCLIDEWQAGNIGDANDACDAHTKHYQSSTVNL